MSSALGFTHSADTTGKIKQNMCVADHPSLLLLSMYPREVLTDVHEEMGTRALPAVLFIIVKIGDNIHFIINKMWKLVWYPARCAQAHLDTLRYRKVLLFMMNIHVCCWCQSHGNC